MEFACEQITLRSGAVVQNAKVYVTQAAPWPIKAKKYAVTFIVHITAPSATTDSALQVDKGMAVANSEFIVVDHYQQTIELEPENSRIIQAIADDEITSFVFAKILGSTMQ